jgi:hypothetical protein
MLQRRRNVEEGARARNRSRRYQVRAAKRRDRDRRLAAERRRCHGELANRIPGQGTTVKTEKLSYKAWQRQYPRALRCVALVSASLRNKPGCEPIEFGTRYTCLSQFCHVDGTYTKKTLNQRFHQFPDGTKVFVFCLPGSFRPGRSSRCDPGRKVLDRCAKRSCEWRRTDLNLREGACFALPHAVLGVRAGRSKNSAECTCEAGNAVAVAHLAAVRVLESGAVGTQAPAGLHHRGKTCSRWAAAMHRCRGSSTMDEFTRALDGGLQSTAPPIRFGVMAGWTA